jgi:hypothetical protein
MKTINDDTRQQALDWSRRLGNLAAGIQPVEPAGAAAEAGPALRARLSSLLARHQQQNSPRQQAAHKLKVNLFMAGS